MSRVDQLIGDKDMQHRLSLFNLFSLCSPEDRACLPLIEKSARLQVDSRAVCSGDVFIALAGSKSDGHLFLDEVKKRGARLAVIRHDYEGALPDGLDVMKVPDTLAFLQSVARTKISVVNPHIVAITGSVGKTTTKEFVKTLLHSEKKVFSTTGNMNSQIGLSLSIVNEALGDEEWYVLEMGMTEHGNISKLVSIAPPDIACITSIHLVHSQFFSGLEEIARAKSEIFSSPKTYLRIVNRESHAFSYLESCSSIPIKTYSVNGNSAAYWKLERTAGVVHVLEDGRPQAQFKDPQFIAEHVYDNLLAAISIARSAGISWSGIEKAVQQLKLPSLRLEVTLKGGIHFINDSYNASEPSMLSALKTLGAFPLNQQGRKIAILGQMRELGVFSQGCHERVGEASAAQADIIFCLGEEAAPIFDVCKKKNKPVFWTLSFEELMNEFMKAVRPGDAVLLKGSKSNQLWRVLDYFNVECD